MLGMQLFVSGSPKTRAAALKIYVILHRFHPKNQKTAIADQPSDSGTYFLHIWDPHGMQIKNWE